MDVVAFFFICLLLGAWLLVLVTAWNQTKQKTASQHLSRALALWPVVLVDEVIRLVNIPDWYALAGLFHFVPVLIGTMLLHHIRRLLQPETAISKAGSVSMVVLSGLAILPLLLKPIDYGQWLSGTPVGDVKLYWWVYLPYLVSSGALLLIGGRMFDICRRYHQCLSWQAVDIQRYQGHVLTVTVVLLLLVSAISIGIVFSVASNTYALDSWPLLIDTLFAGAVLGVLARCHFAGDFLPSPIHYEKLHGLSLAPTLQDEALVNRAERGMIASKAYKMIGLTLREFSAQIGVDPTALLIALKRVKKQDFRGFIFHYRMEYARNVVMRSDAKIATVAKRLGFHSEKFLSGPFLNYLEKRR